MSKPSANMLGVMNRIHQGERVQWNSTFQDTPDAHTGTVVALLRRGLVQTLPGGCTLALTAKGLQQLGEVQPRVSV